MRKFGVILVPILVSVIILGTGSVHAAKGPAVVIYPAECVTYWPGDNKLDIITDNVMVKSASGNWKVTCNGFLPAGVPPPTTIVKWSGGPPDSYCSSIWGQGYYSVIITDTGAVHMTCFNKA
jgi:hypothetical protein